MSKNGAKQRILRARTEAFLDAHPDGWYDGDWCRFIAELDAAGVDISDLDTIGLELERGRLLRTLSGLQLRGLGPRRTAALASRYGTIWNLRRAPTDDLASVPGMNRQVADGVKSALG